MFFAFDASVGVAKVSFYHRTDGHLFDHTCGEVAVGDAHIQQFGKAFALCGTISDDDIVFFFSDFQFGDFLSK